MSCEASFTANDFLVGIGALIVLFLLLRMWVFDRIMVALFVLLTLVIGGVVRVIDYFYAK